MNNIDDFKKSIEIPSEINLAIEKGIKRGKEEKIKRKGKFKYKKIVAVSGIAVAMISVIGFTNPQLVEALPGIGSIFKQITHGNMGEPIDKFEKYATNINQTVEDNGIKINVDQVTIDDNSLAITALIEGKDLKQDEGIMSSMKLNNQEVNTHSDKQKKLEDGSLMVVTYANISDLKIDKDINLDWNIAYVGDKKGKWDFKFKVNKNKETNSKVININKKIKIPNSTLEVQNIVVSSLGNSINIKGTYDEVNNSKRTGIEDYLVLDEKGNILITRQNSSCSTDKEYDIKLSILSDVKDFKRITLIPLFNTWGTRGKEVNNISYDILQCTINNNDFKNTPQEIVQKSRPATDKEKKDGYAYNEVTHIYKIDKNKDFKPLNELINQEIVLGDKSKAIIKGIDSTDKYTKLTFKLEGYYKYDFVNSVVLLDEDFNDVERAEDGEAAILEDTKNNIVSIKLSPIDNKKKYKIALPMIKDPVVDDKYKLDINLK
ncbi:protein of unknown function [Clostridium cavendishii DSM 21758]|uniref:DUF4179 domain-containing protein n=1 Tax=Clostridium cavendishii DSM 21758 TaxID=1121302 RepID=A0A1M6TGK2_9CLOT|nr:DUF4179 domain-containing protein [Clostridium cavendishii]SHK56034.1 protein of unknown function [Clostridium cavendishii DSM 21758]